MRGVCRRSGLNGEVVLACAMASEAGIHLEVTIVGDADATPESRAIEHELQELAATPALSGKVRFAGTGSQYTI